MVDPLRDDSPSDEVRERGFRREVGPRRPAPRFADATWVHAVIGAPVGASIAFLLQAPPRTLEHAVVGAMAGSLFGVIIGAFRPAPEEPVEPLSPGRESEPSEDPDAPHTP
jgi:hypothetical protein